MATTYTNGAVTATKDLFLGWSVLTISQGSSSSVWMPIKELDKQTLNKVHDQLFDPIFPQELRDAVRTALDDSPPDLISA